MISRNSKEYLEWRDQVRYNFDNKCHWCGSSEDLCAHHEIPFTGETPETDLDTDNGICLCRTCHNRLHNTGENHPMYGKQHSEESRKNMSESKIGEKNPMHGKVLSEETKKKISESLSGENHPMYGKHHTEESLRKMSESLSGENHPRGMLGKHHTEETIQKISEAHIGKAFTEEHKKKLSDAKSGENHPRGMLGKHHSEETKAKANYSRKITRLNKFIKKCQETEI